jgi:3,4-dihydroxy 2-butanone 4-phosphate synthase/GTP cyclohydrolase II
MNDDGTMARRPELEHFAREHRLCFVSIEDLITFRLLQESHIERMELGTIDTSWGRFQAASYRSLIDSHCHLAVTSDGLDPEAVVDVRVQRQDYYGDIFGGLTQGSRQKIDYGMQLVKKEKNAVFLFLSSDLPQKAYLDSFRRLLLKGSEQEIFAKEKSVSDSQMDLRQLGIGAQILKDLGVKRMRLHLSRPISLKGLGGFGLEVMGTTLIKN